MMRQKLQNCRVRFSLVYLVAAGSIKQIKQNLINDKLSNDEPDQHMNE